MTTPLFFREILPKEIGIKSAIRANIESPRTVLRSAVRGIFFDKICERENSVLCFIGCLFLLPSDRRAN